MRVARSGVVVFSRHGKFKAHTKSATSLIKHAVFLDCTAIWYLIYWFGMLRHAAAPGQSWNNFNFEVSGNRWRGQAHGPSPPWNCQFQGGGRSKGAFSSDMPLPFFYLDTQAYTVCNVNLNLMLTFIFYVYISTHIVDIKINFLRKFLIMSLFLVLSCTSAVMP